MFNPDVSVNYGGYASVSPRSKRIGATVLGGLLGMTCYYLPVNKDLFVGTAFSVARKNAEKNIKALEIAADEISKNKLTNENKIFLTQMGVSENLQSIAQKCKELKESITDKDKVIAHVNSNGKLIMECTIGNGRGYVRCDEQKKLLGNVKAGVIAIDSLYSPIERVSYDVEPARVGQNENYDKLIMNVWTNGAIKPEEAMALSARILCEHFEIVASIDNIADTKGLMNEKVEDPRIKIKEIGIFLSSMGYPLPKRYVKKLKGKPFNYMYAEPNIGYHINQEHYMKESELEENYRGI